MNLPNNMQDTSLFYQAKASLSQEIVEKVQSLVGVFKLLDPDFQPENFFISDYLIGDEREWKHIYFFSSHKIWIAYKFQTNQEYEQIPFPTQNTFPVQVSVKSFDCVTYNDKSRFAVTVQVGKSSLELKATQANCMVLLNILKSFFIRSISE